MRFLNEEIIDNKIYNKKRKMDISDIVLYSENTDLCSSAV